MSDAAGRDDRARGLRRTSARPPAAVLPADEPARHLHRGPATRGAHRPHGAS